VDVAALKMLLDSIQQNGTNKQTKIAAFLHAQRKKNDLYPAPGNESGDRFFIQGSYYFRIEVCMGSCLLGCLVIRKQRFYFKLNIPRI
jgi:hypothetical protein